MNILRKFVHKLQWQIVGSQIVVTLVSIGVVMLMTRMIFLGILPTTIEPILTNLVEEGADAIEVAKESITLNFRNVVIFSTFIAAIGAIFIGWFNSILLSRIITNPLHSINYSSQRISDGRYDERIPVPETEELASVALQFNQMAETLEQVEQNRVSLIGNVSHELRTPLTTLQGYVEGLQDGLFPQDEETYGIMHEEIARLRRLVDDLQMLSRVEGGQFSLEPLDFEITPLVYYVVKQLQPRFVGKGQSVEVVSNDVPVNKMVHADRDRAAQVLFNLMGNAIRYTPERGEIKIELNQAGQHLTVSVVDNGAGIPAESIPYLFERFYRVDPSRSRKSGGSGIGLTISRHLARAMGGEITVQSEGSGKGSRFVFSLPISIVEADTEPELTLIETE